MPIADPRLMRTVPSIIGVAALALALGCGGYVAVEGYDADYVDAPAGIEAYPHYVYNGEYVYDVDGRFYRNHGGRWVRYRHAPPEVARWHEQGRGRAERQR